MIEFQEVTVPMWALVLGTLMLIGFAFIAWWMYKAVPEEELFKETKLCHYLMDGMVLEKGDTVSIDGEIHIISEKEAEILNNGEIGCAHVTVIRLAS